MIDRVGKQRVQKLINFMAALPPEASEHFEMNYWFVHEGRHSLKLSKKGFVTKKTLQDCGTKACALGWASAVPGFYKAGLRIVPSAIGPINYDAGIKFFRISVDQANELFGTGARARTRAAVTPQQWALLAQQLLNEWSER